MFEPVSSALGIAWLGYASVNAYARRGSAVSTEAYALRQAATQIVDSVERSRFLFGLKAANLSRLYALTKECEAADWDGSGAEPIDRAAVALAAEFIRVLPDSVPPPEFAVDPDGAVALDWIESRTRIFSLSIGKTSRLSFAWLDGTDSGHGVAKFDGMQTPKRVLEGIQAIVGHGDSALAA